MIRQRGDSWQADCKVDGKRIRKSFPTKQEAEAFKKATEQGLEVSSVPVTLKPFCEKFFDHIWANIKHPEVPRQNLGHLYSLLGENTPLNTIKTVQCIEMIEELKRQGLSNGTINRKLSTLSKALKYAERLEVIQKRPILDFQKETNVREFVLTPSDEERVFRLVDHWGLGNTKALMQFLLYTGCRLGEAYKITREDVRGGKVYFKDTKNGTNRAVPLNANAKAALDVVWPVSPLLFSVAIPRGTFRGHWRRIRQQLYGVDHTGFIPHCLRHTCCTRLVSRGASLPLVMEWMGHKNIATTIRYAHLAPDNLKGMEDLI